jgi:hypothetical protein
MNFMNQKILLKTFQIDLNYHFSLSYYFQKLIKLDCKKLIFQKYYFNFFDLRKSAFQDNIW